MATYYAREAARALTGPELRDAIGEALRAIGPRRRIAVVPPDITRLHSFAGRVTELAWEHHGDAVTDVLPALGTHTAMSPEELARMFGRVPHHLFRVHRFREDVETLGRIPGDEVRELSEGKLSFDWPAQVNRLLVRGGHDLVLCVGQVVPHEVAGVAGQSKTLLIGTGGEEAIHKSHFLGAVYGMERIMGRVRNPVRALLERASERFLRDVPVAHLLTVVGTDALGKPAVRGVFAGDDQATFERAAALAMKVNFTLLDEPLHKVVAYLDPDEYRSTWLGNKAIYRTRMAIADGGELVILAPGVRRFGEDPGIDRLIRRHGYFTTPEVLARVDADPELRASLSAAAHLIHGSSEGRFTITYCPGGLTRDEIERANFRFGDPDRMLARYHPAALREGWNTLPDGERVFFISNPAMGLWALRSRFLAA